MTDTKTCNLTADEIKYLINNYGSGLAHSLSPDYDGSIERINYLNKRLKEFSKVAKITESAAVAGWPA